MKYRIEKDTLGEVEVPADVYYGPQTQRSVNNFKIATDISRMPEEVIEAFAYLKKGAALANKDAGVLSPEKCELIGKVCDEILAGKLNDSFPLIVWQTGSGTQTNMNVNEVIANRALELLGHEKGEYQFCHPNNHVNLSQSTNDAYPTAMKIALIRSIAKLEDSLKQLVEAFRAKGVEFADVIKMGRTQLQDAVPMTLGQTFHGFASVLRGEVDNLDHAAQEFLSINMGATAIGTGICAEPGYAERCTAAIREITGWDVTLAEDLVGATSDTVCMVGYSSAMKRIASKMNKICNDLRLLSSGPRCGLGEFNLPARQPGSSIMPGKVNPVIPEVMNQIAFKVIGNELCVTMADEAAQMELNAMEPVMAQCCFESAELLINGFDTLRIRCVDGITANEEKCLQYVRNSIGVVTALNPIIGYKNSTKIAKEALETGRGVYELVLEHGILNRDELDEVLRPENMIHPVKLDIKPRR